jgi:malate dehydrogenase (oxaloacetate-decarboxylating)
VVLAGVLSGLRATGRTLGDARIVVVGAGGAGIGIGRLLRAAMGEAGLSEAAIGEAIALVDTQGLVHAGRTDLDATKRELAVPAVDGPATPTLLEVVRDRRPTILVGATGVAGTFTEAVIDAMVERVGPADRPIVMPLSNPTSASEATPADVLAWSQGRAIIATGSPFEAVTLDGVRHEIGQANNAFIFPGVGLGAIVAETRAITDRMFLLAARTLAAAVTDERIAAGALYPPISSLRAVSREIATAVVREAIETGVAGAAISPEGASAAVDAATWWPAYVPYEPLRFVERRRENET